MTVERFIVDGEDGATSARAGTLRCTAGDVPTPVFMPVASAGSLKTLSHDDLEALGTKALIANALLLSLRPGREAVQKAGGLGKLMGYRGAVFTDSGGFQIVRERYRPRLDDDGIEFNDPYDGSRVKVTPESIVDIQLALGSDVAMVLDDCAPHPYTDERLEQGMRRTMDWARRCLGRWRDALDGGAGGAGGGTRSDAADGGAAGGGTMGGGDLPPPVSAGGERPPMLFAIVQGGTDKGLREKCARELGEIGFDGYGIGGLSLGEGREEMLRAVSWSVDALPPKAPRYLMGVGSPVELLDAVERGVDIFDSVYPTRNARHGTAFVPGGTLDLRRKRWAGDGRPLWQGCGCPACSGLTTGYLHHLFDVKELSGLRLLSVHNLTFMARFTGALRRSVVEGGFQKFAQEVRLSWKRGEGEPAGDGGPF